MYRIIPIPSKELTIVFIAKGPTTNIHRISLMYDIEVFLTIYIGQHLYADFEATDSLPNYFNAYCKGKSIDDLTLTHILILEKH